MMLRRVFLVRTGGLATWLASQPTTWLMADEPQDDLLTELKLGWTSQLKWSRVVDVSRVPGESVDEKLASAQAMLAMRGGGVAFFPAGTYRFRESIKLLDGVVLRGAVPGTITSAQNEKYALPTKFEFPKYEFSPEGDGTPIVSPFKGIYLAEAATASNVGVVNIDINRGHIHFHDDGTEAHRAGRNRVVFGCILWNGGTRLSAEIIPHMEFRK